MKYYILFNSSSDNGLGKDQALNVEKFLNGSETEYIDVLGMETYSDFLKGISGEDAVVLCGGDGTINYFINHSEEKDYEGKNIYYFPTGTGNDFLRDATGSVEPSLVLLNQFLVNLPTVTIDGKTSKFINGIGYGIDGYCCEVADELKKTPGKKIDYTAIAIKGLLFHYQPTEATVICDGEEHHFHKVWLVPTMKGRFYGGGMIPTPDQNRFSDDRKVSAMVFYGKGRIKSLIVFPNIFKGEHVKHTELCSIFSGNEITVRFDRPTALQIDGETVLGVTEYTVKTK